MTVIGLDDTDSRTAGMCTTYLAALVAEAIADAGGAVERRVLVRLNPAVEHKTRGNAALAVHADVAADRAFEIAADLVDEYAVAEDARTSPGLVVADADPESIPDRVAEFSRAAVRRRHDLPDALELADDAGFRHRGWGAKTGDGTPGRGRIGALAAVGAWPAIADRTVEHISYREFDRCGTPRDVDVDSAFAAADREYPDAWDTVDRGTDEAVCVPNAPGPILFGVRGDDDDAVRRVADGIDAEPVERTALFHTNQGTDAHLADAGLHEVRDGRGYRVTGEVVEAPETRRGGHVFLTLGSGRPAGASDGDDGGDTVELDCVAFAPTGRFRWHVRKLIEGDRVTACGEVDEGTLKLEKFAVRSLVETERVVPSCPDCDLSMESAGADQGYRCQDCGTARAGKVERDRPRELELGWYEVPPTARRHVSKPLIRGGFDAPTHPER
ncbi:tRNA(Ile)(2)-agmatinylcytidine synthase [Halorarum halobium]|uniref:tRNA(Ile)(2)-agmatinylcytidine synthase n=1 Tax=Halorarum halobium TaxID=3075121 RepID=UPI0028AFEA03|nr:tRNA(Ile)(2)-agmatinylcytidine synthase [Halobaculum sp. XH14]